MTNQTKSNTSATTKGSSARQEFSDAAHSARENVREMGSAVKAVAGEQVDHLVAEVDELKQALRAKVEERPIKSVLIAAGAGILLGLLLRRS